MSVAVSVGVAVGALVSLGVNVGVAVSVKVEGGVKVSLGVSEGVCVGALVSVAVGVKVGGGVLVVVSDGVTLAVSVEVEVGMGVREGSTETAVSANVGEGVRVGTIVGVAWGTPMPLHAEISSAMTSISAQCCIALPRPCLPHVISTNHTLLPCSGNSIARPDVGMKYACPTADERCVGLTARSNGCVRSVPAPNARFLRLLRPYPR